MAGSKKIRDAFIKSEESGKVKKLQELFEHQRPSRLRSNHHLKIDDSEKRDESIKVNKLQDLFEPKRPQKLKKNQHKTKLNTADDFEKRKNVFVSSEGKKKEGKEYRRVLSEPCGGRRRNENQKEETDVIKAVHKLEKGIKSVPNGTSKPKSVNNHEVINNRPLDKIPRKNVVDNPWGESRQELSTRCNRFDDSSVTATISSNNAIESNIDAARMKMENFDAFLVRRQLDNNNSPEMKQEDFGERKELEEILLEALNMDGGSLYESKLITRYTNKKNVHKFRNADLVLQQTEDNLICASDEEDLSSKRNTMMSTDEDDEGVEIRSKSTSSDSSENRKTFMDLEGNMRIQREISEKTEPEDKLNLVPGASQIFYILNELRETEIKYLEDLKKVLKHYKPYIEANAPAALRSQSCYIFANIDRIYDMSRNFLKALQRAGDDTLEVARAFLIFEGLFELYPHYFKNKPKADITLKEFYPIMKEKQQELGDKLDLSSYLLTPLQRLGKYKLMLENIKEELVKKDCKDLYLLEQVTKAVRLVKRIMADGNDKLAIESIKEAPFEKECFGTFLLRDEFHIFKKDKKQMLFLFQNMVIFTEPIKNTEEFRYIYNIRMEDLAIKTSEKHPLSLVLRDFPKYKKQRNEKYNFFLTASSEKIKVKWQEQIEEILWKQLEKAKDQIKEEYQNKTKPEVEADASLPVTSLSRSTSLKEYRTEKVMTRSNSTKPIKKIKPQAQFYV